MGARRRARRTTRAAIVAAGWLIWMVPAAVGLFDRHHAFAAVSLDQLTDLTGRATAVVTLRGRDNFTSEYRYDVSVKNLSPDPLIGDSLVVVVDKITNLAGEDRDPLKGESFLSRFEVLGQDGETDDGKPYFRVPAGSGPDLLPQSESRPVTVRLRNKEYLIVFTPSFRVLGLKRPPAAPKPSEQVTTTPPAKNPLDKLIELLIKKGVITEEEWRGAAKP
ncbi:MAG TPA: hypothetical protein VNK46_12255 [Nitrospiraceae bacterium]|nr:hypothetical protein [Nitrospiraceae bacterium]